MKDDVPFIFGRVPATNNFTDREKETKHLKQNFKGLINTIIISPRRWGKSSLVDRVAENFLSAKSPVKVCRVDLFNVRTEEDFYHTLAQEVLRATASKWEEMMANAKTFLSALLPQIGFSPDGQSEITFGIAWEKLRRQADTILDLAETIAAKKKIKIVVCIDEFQSVGEFKNSLAVQRKLRSHWQRHQQVAYCLYGSKRHMMLDIFTNSSMPFYKFGDLMFLEKIDTPHWVSFIQQRFKDTRKQISERDARNIAVLADNHPYYVQQLAQQVWLRTKLRCAPDIVMDAYESLVRQLSLLFTNTTETLTITQVNFLKALLTGETQFSAQNTLQQYRLGTSANILRIKKTLEKREIIDIVGSSISFQDPIYRYWLQKYYFAL